MAFLLHFHLASGQGNIPKGYKPYVNIVPPDTTLSVTDVFWGYDDPTRLCVYYGYSWESPKLLILNTNTWAQEGWIEIPKSFRPYAFTPDNKSIILSRHKKFLFFSSKQELLFIDLENYDSKFYSEKELQTYISENGKLNPGKDFLFLKYMLSPDREYFITNSRFPTQDNPDDLIQKGYQLIIFKYTEEDIE
ncbi:hypothetical protein [Flammeovirga aprica]|uniref:Uncharacterized protein n=1 Tax=Flammeovirga aprica JL-4 TaxID=694437 RepID=A0A7X9RYV3_9BACT|nr:hypothetical protein [Flammeovirga aprica]NME71241.1 hypothetical protein [Flammeovirga aprica JL-4]